MNPNANPNEWTQDPTVAAADPAQNPVAHQAHAGTVFQGATSAPTDVTNLKRVLDPSRIGTDFPDPRTMGANRAPAASEEAVPSMPVTTYSEQDPTGHRRAVAGMTIDPQYNDLNQAPAAYETHPGNRAEPGRTTFTSNDTQLPPPLTDNEGNRKAAGTISPLAPNGFVEGDVPEGLTRQRANAISAGAAPGSDAWDV